MTHISSHSDLHTKSFIPLKVSAITTEHWECLNLQVESNLSQPTASTDCTWPGTFSFMLGSAEQVVGDMMCWQAAVSMRTVGYCKLLMGLRKLNLIFGDASVTFSRAVLGQSADYHYISQPIHTVDMHTRDQNIFVQYLRQRRRVSWVQAYITYSSYGLLVEIATKLAIQKTSAVTWYYERQRRNEENEEMVIVVAGINATMV